MPTPITTHAQAVAALMRLVGLDEEISDADTILFRDTDGKPVTAGDIVDCLRPDLRQPAPDAWQPTTTRLAPGEQWMRNVLHPDELHPDDRPGADRPAAKRGRKASAK